MSRTHGAPDLGTEITLPDGSVEAIKVVDSMRDTFTTESGEWHAEDVIPIPPPADPAELDAWLDAPSWKIVPRLQIELVMKRCPEMNPHCKCAQCYRVYHTEPDGGVRGSYHFRDNNACRCDGLCCAD